MKKFRATPKMINNILNEYPANIREEMTRRFYLDIIHKNPPLDWKINDACERGETIKEFLKRYIRIYAVNIFLDIPYIRNRNDLTSLLYQGIYKELYYNGHSGVYEILKTKTINEKLVKSILKEYPTPIQGEIIRRYYIDTIKWNPPSKELMTKIKDYLRNYCYNDPEHEALAQITIEHYYRIIEQEQKELADWTPKMIIDKLYSILWKKFQ